MYELIITGGNNDGKILGEFHSIEDARDYQDAFNNERFPVDHAEVYLYGEIVRRY